MNPYSIPPLLCAIFVILLGLFVFLKNPKSTINRTFALLCYQTFHWQAGWFSIYYSTSDIQRDFIVKLGFSLILFIPFTYYHFAAHYVDSKKDLLWVKRFYLIGIMWLVILWLSNLFITGHQNFSWGNYAKGGNLLPLYLLFAGSAIIRTLTILRRSTKNGKITAIIRNQNKFVYLAAWLYCFASVEYIIDYGVPIYPIGVFFILGSFSVIAYAIVRHRLMEIEVVIKKTLVYAGLFTFAFGIIVGVAMITQELLSQFLPINRFVSLAISAVIIVFSLRPLENFLINATNRFLFQKKYDPRRLLKDFGDRVLTVLNLEEIVTSTIDVLVKSLNIETCAVLLLNRDEARYEVYSSYGLKDERISFGGESRLASYLSRTHEMILKDSYDENLEAPRAVGPDMEKIGSHLCIPLLLHDEMIGILSLGKKRSDEPYNRADVDILSTLAKTVAIAVSNAQLFLEAAQSEKLAAIGTLAAGIGHEVCNPLNTISTNIQVFLESLKLGFYKGKTQEELVDEAKRVMEGCLKDMNKIGDVAKNLASFAKPAKEVAMKAVNISDEVDEALAIVGHGLELEKIEVEKIIPPELPPILAGKGQLRQIFFNLIRNASQAIEGSGKITVSAKRYDDKVQIEITDTGRGISEDKLRRVYDPFFTTRVPGEGTGLGLSIVRQLVGRNKGKISVRSKVGRGTTFLLEFPVST